MTPFPYDIDLSAVDLKATIDDMPDLADIRGSCVLRRVREPYGVLQNMSPHPVAVGGLRFRTSEAAFQAMRFPAASPTIAKIRTAKSPMQAKFAAKGDAAGMVVEQLSARDVANMALCLKAKYMAHMVVRDTLMATVGRYIVEDCTSRQRGSGLFWGAARVGERWRGHNVLGRLWMALREEMM